MDRDPRVVAPKNVESTPQLLRGALVYAAAAAAQSGGVLVATMLSAFYLDASSYSEFSFVLYWTSLLALVLDAGIGQSVLRGMAASGDLNSLAAGVRMKWAIAAVASVSAVAITLAGASVAVVIIVIAASTTSLNATVRVYDTHKRDLWALGASAVVMLSCAGVAVLLVRWRPDWKLAAASALAVPPLAASLMRVRRRELPTRASLASDVRGIREFAPYLFVSGILFAALVPLSLVLLKARLAAAEYGALALATSVVGALSLLVTSFRATGYAAIARDLNTVGDAPRARIALLLRRSAPLVAAYALGAAGVCIFAFVAYEAKFPGVALSCAVLSLGFGATGVLGLYNIRHQVRGLKRLEVVVNVGRVSTLLLFVIFVADDAIDAAAAIAAVISVGEFTYAVLGDVLAPSNGVGA